MPRFLKTLALTLSLLPLMAYAEDARVTRAVDGVILPAFANFASTTATLATAAKADCTAQSPALLAAYNAAFDAWAAAAPFRLGPLEEQGRGLAIAFWPDPKGNTPKSLTTLISSNDPALSDPAHYATQSVAARGFFALDAMLGDPQFNTYGPNDPGCKVTQAITGDLAGLAAQINTDWQTFGPLLKTAGDPGNTRFLAPGEAIQALYTSLLTELEFTADERIGRPLGTFDRPRPLRSEARLTDRPLRNVTGSLAAIRALATALSDGKSTETFVQLDYTDKVAAKLKDATFASVDTPVGRLKIQDLHDAITRVRDTAKLELGAELEVMAGFNSLDGD